VVRSANPARSVCARDQNRIGRGGRPQLPDPVAGARQRLRHCWYAKRRDADARVLRTGRWIGIVEMDL